MLSSDVPVMLAVTGNTVQEFGKDHEINSKPRENILIVDVILDKLVNMPNSKKFKASLILISDIHGGTLPMLLQLFLDSYCEIKSSKF